MTPVYNAARFLDEALQSVAAQDYHDWELLLVDDGSTDESGRIAEDWRCRDERMRLLRHPRNENCGSSASRNLAIAHSRGELIAMLDADDVWMPGKLRFQIDLLDRHPTAAMTYGATQRWYSWDEASRERDYMVPSFGADTLIPPPELLRAFLEDESLTPCACAIVFRRSAIVAADAFEPSFPGLYDDQVFLAKLCLNQPVFASSECVARYRKHSGSCCAIAEQNGTAFNERQRFLRWLTAYQSSCVNSF